MTQHRATQWHCALLDHASQRSRGSETVAEFENVLNFAPVDWPSIEPQTEPTLGTYVRGQVEALRFAACAVDVLAQRRLAAHGNDAVAVVVVEEIRKDLLAYAKDS